jgi:hypothetical protein
MQIAVLLASDSQAQFTSMPTGQPRRADNATPLDRTYCTDFHTSSCASSKSYHQPTATRQYYLPLRGQSMAACGSATV